MSCLTIISQFMSEYFTFANTPNDKELNFIIEKVLRGLSSSLNRPDFFGRFVKMLLFDGPNVGIQNPSVRDRYRLAIEFEESRNFVVVPIIVVNDMYANFIPYNENTIYIVVDDPSKTIDDAVIGMILQTIGRNISFFSKMVYVGICSSDTKLINSYDDNECVSADRSYSFGQTSEAKISIFCGAVCLRANTGSNLVISFLIPDTHQNRIPRPDYESVVHPEALLNLQMMDIDGAYHAQLNQQRRIDKSIRDLFLGLFVQGVIHKNGNVTEIRSTESTRQYATALTPVHSSLLKLVAKIQPC